MDAKQSIDPDNFHAFNKEGWKAIRHRTEKWWFGTDEGVLCYPNIEIARAALTIIWQMDGGRVLNFYIDTFDGKAAKGGEYRTAKSAFVAIMEYERRAT